MNKDNKDLGLIVEEKKKVSKATIVILGVLICVLIAGLGFLVGSNMKDTVKGSVKGGIKGSDKSTNKVVDNTTAQENTELAVDMDEEEKEKLIGEEEKRILAGEIVIYRLEEGKKSGELCKLDLNLDGEKEVISISDFKVTDERENLDIKINDCEVTFENFSIEPELVALALDDEKIILAAHANGMSDDPVTYLYVYNGEKIINGGSFYNDITCAIDDMANEQVVIKNNIIKCASHEGTISNYVYRHYHWDGKELIKKDEPVLKYTNPKEELRLIKDIEVYKSYDDESEPQTMKKGIVHPINKGPNNWNYIKGEDGTEGWFTFEQDEYFEIFENMNLAG
ncbi:MAG: hypothetical protein E7262_09300 [Lachnospiraceae bacterium]|nr:hypothetical protein [Lachnospiraceae bacterium]